MIVIGQRINYTPSTPRQWYVYALCDPDTNSVRYIGQSLNPIQRLHEHIATALSDYPVYPARRRQWIRSLAADGRYPYLTIIDALPTLQAAAQRERALTTQHQDTLYNGAWQGMDRHARRSRSVQPEGFTIAEVATQLQVSRQRVHQMLTAEQMHPHRLMGQYVLTAAQLQQLQQRQRSPRSPGRKPTIPKTLHR